MPAHGADVAVPAGIAGAAGIEQLLIETVGGDARRPSVEVVAVADGSRSERARDARQAAQGVVGIRLRRGQGRRAMGNGEYAGAHPVSPVVGIDAVDVCRPGIALAALYVHAQRLAGVCVGGAGDAGASEVVGGLDLRDVVA